MAQTLRTRLIARDAARFVGRADELARLDALLGDEPSASVVLLHGPPGVGKSALLRELARRGELGGMTPFEIEARDLAPLADALDEAIAPALRASRPLLLLDSWERLTALDAHLRRDLLPRLPFDALVVVASRRAPGPGWFGGGWENLVLDLALGPMDRAEAEALLAARGLSDPDLRAETVAWAGGSPLALVLAADAGGGGAGRTGRCSACRRRCAPAPAPRHPAGGRHAQRPAGRGARARHDSGPARRGAARRRCRACLPVAARASERGATPRGSDAPRPRRPSAAADLRRRSPELERDLRRRLVDTLYARSMKEGLLQLTLDLQHLVQDPAIRWGFSWDSSGRPRIDTPRSGDFEGIAAGGGRAALGWLESARRYFDDAPDRVIVVRDQDDEIAGYGVNCQWSH